MITHRLFCLFAAGTLASQAAPVMTALSAADVSPSGLRLVWQTDVPAEPVVQVFTNAAGTTAAAGVTVEPFAALSDYTTLLLANAGVITAEITGLTPDTQYYVRASSRSLADSTTTAAPLLPVRTAISNSPASLAAPFTALTNPVVRFTCLSADSTTGADTGIVLARVSGARTPVSSALGNRGVVYLDMANLISQASGRTLAVAGGETLDIEFHRGGGVVESHRFYMPSGDGLGTVQDPRLTPGPLTGTVIRSVPGGAGPARVFMEFPATAGEYYDVFMSPTLATGEWLKVDPGLLATDSRLFWEDHGLAPTPTAPAVTPRRFYKLEPFSR